jgi:hypothetical protein
MRGSASWRSVPRPIRGLCVRVLSENVRQRQPKPPKREARKSLFHLSVFGCFGLESRPWAGCPTQRPGAAKVSGPAPLGTGLRQMLAQALPGAIPAALRPKMDRPVGYTGPASESRGFLSNWGERGVTNRPVRDPIGGEATYFITVDLDIYSKRRLARLVEALGDKVTVLHEGRWGSRYSANLEGTSWRRARGKEIRLTADQEIRELIALIKHLPRPARHLWDGAQSRVFNVGVQAGLHPHAHELRLSSRTLLEVARLRADVAITTYAPEVPEGTPSVGGGGSAQRLMHPRGRKSLGAE